MTQKKISFPLHSQILTGSLLSGGPAHLKQEEVTLSELICFSLSLNDDSIWIRSTNTSATEALEVQRRRLFITFHLALGDEMNDSEIDESGSIFRQPEKRDRACGGKRDGSRRVGRRI